MANVNIKFNNKDYLLSCDDGQEESLKKLTKFLDKKYSELKDKLGNIGENKLLLITTIQLIDEYFDLKQKITDQRAKLDEISGKFREIRSLAIQYKKDKDIDADVIIATPECMKSLGQLGRILGPKNLMPNPKEGTVTKNVADAVSVAKKGQIRYKTDKGGIIHATIGKKDFEPKKLAENAIALIEDLKKAKPSSAKGKYMKNITISSTMGPGIRVDLSSVEKRS